MLKICHIFWRMRALVNISLVLYLPARVCPLPLSCLKSADDLTPVKVAYIWAKDYITWHIFF